MASETNELTFVRCPTCRSLVPASAARCRICNAALEAGGSKGGAPETPSQTGRVRQKTVSASPAEVQSAVAGTSSPAAPPQPSNPVVASPVEAAAKPTNDDDAFDPLGAFLQDLDSDESTPSDPVDLVQEEPVVGARAPVPPSAERGKEILFDDDNDDGEDDDDDLDEFDLDIFDDPSFDELGDKGDPLSLLEPLGEEVPTFEAREESESSARKARSEEGPAEVPTRKPTPSTSQAPAPRSETARPQAGAPAQSARGSELEKPAAPPQQAKQQPQGRQAPPPMRPKMAGQPMQAAQKPPRPQEQSTRPKPPPQQPQQNRQPERPEQPRREREDSPGGYTDPMRNARDAQRPGSGVRRDVASAPKPEVTAAGPRISKSKPGRLFGWLVSYENADGRAIELRAGRFFVTGTTIRGSDLILEDQSISTPHALMSINERGLLLQDLMSERGTFVRAPGEAQYRREDGIIEVQHGDWIRFGDVEFLVTIVPG